MRTVSQLLESKKQWHNGDHGQTRVERVHTISQAATILDAAKLMNEHHVGSLVVFGTLSDIVGIISERDILTRVIAAELDPKTTTVSKAMTSKVITCDSDTNLDEVRHLMTDCRIRHLPVVNKSAGKETLVGMISIGDLNAASNLDLNIEVKTMRSYIAQG